MTYIDPSIKTSTANTGSVNSTAKTGTNNKEFCLDDVLLRLLSGDISALTELKANNISYIKKGSDGDFVITFLYEQEKYEVHCFVNPDTNSDVEDDIPDTNSPSTNPSNTTTEEHPVVNNPSQSDTSEEVPSNTTEDVTIPSDSVTDTPDVEDVEDVEAPNDVQQSSPVDNQTDNLSGADKCAVVDALIGQYTSEITNALLNIENFMGLTGKKHMDNLGYMLADRFNNYVNTQLFASGAVLKFISGEISQSEFEECILKTIELAKTEPYIALALQDNPVGQKDNSENIPKDVLAQNLLNSYAADVIEKLQNYPDCMKNPAFVSEEHYIEIFQTKFNEDVESSGIVEKFINGEISQKEFEAALEIIINDTRTCYELREIFFDFLYNDDTMVEVYPTPEEVIDELNSRGIGDGDMTQEGFIDDVTSQETFDMEGYAENQGSVETPPVSDYQKEKNSIKVDKLVDFYITDIYDRIQYNLDSVKYTTGGDAAKNLAEKFKALVMSNLEASGAIDKFINGQISETEFEAYIMTAVAIAKTSDKEIADALYSNAELTEDERIEADRRIHQYELDKEFNGVRHIFYNPRIYTFIAGDGSDYDDLA